MTRFQMVVCGAWLAIAGPAAADDTTDPADPDLPAPPVVPATPTAILDRAAFATTGRTRLGDVLQQLPQHGNASNDQINDAGDGTSPVNLRGIGTIRTLMLINGRRSVAGGFNVDAAVDPDAIPLAAIDHVEIVHGDSSARYGSGAAAGVVNIITRSEFSGAEGTAYAATTPHGDARILDASSIVGYRSESRMFSAMVAADVERQDPVLDGDRGFSSQPMTYDYGARRPVPGGSVVSTGGRIDTSTLGPDHGPLNLCGDGVRYCTSNGAGGYRPFEAPGDLYNYASSSYLAGSLRRISVLGASALHLGWATAFVEGSYLDRTSNHQLAPEPFSSALYGEVISKDSVYNPFGTDVAGIDRRLEELGPRPLRRDATVARLAAGVRGAIPDDAPAFPGWAWQLSYDHGRSETSYHLAAANLTNIGNAIGPSFFDASNGPTCGAPGAVLFGCVPVNLLGPGTLDAAARNYLAMTIGDGQFDELHATQASAHGRLLALPRGGSLSLALGGELRDESGGERRLSDVGPLPENGVSAIAPNVGSARALEAYGELSLVALRDLAPLHSVELDLAARAFRSDLAMSFQHDPRVDGVDWKASAVARSVAGFALRAAYSRSQRLTTLGERLDFLFVDPLPPERVRGVTAGAVAAPPALPGLVASVDYWNIAIRNDPVTGPSPTAIPHCFVRGLESTCERLGRDTSGVDLGAGYQHALAPGLGWLREQIDAQYLLKYDLGEAGRVLHGRGNYDLGVHPTLKANLLAAWHDARGAAGGARLRFIGGFHECNLDQCNAGEPARDVDAFYQLDVYASYTVRGAGATTLVLGVDNLLDRSPPMIYGGRDANSDGATYDFVGRLLYARLSQSF